jgi:cytosolic carboxypeptidase protein 2/3
LIKDELYRDHSVNEN